MEKIIVNGQGATYGRLCSFAAKKVLEGDQVDVINSEKVVITGNKKDIINRFKALRAKGGHSLKGPRVSKIPYKLLKRGIKGMLPDHRRGIGKEASKKVKCHQSVPKEFEEKTSVKIQGPKHHKFITLKELSEKL
ncbi:50S ribosomal protein L13 [Candidatus Pacearchaeota archaeon]|nr:50S ribosomal protein L13 [Candidatus Pacearchaeota archaeon]